MSDEQRDPAPKRQRGRRAAPRPPRRAALVATVRRSSVALAALAGPRLAATSARIAAHRQLALMGAAAIVALGMIGGTIAVAGAGVGDPARRDQAETAGDEASAEPGSGRATPNSPPRAVPHREAPGPTVAPEPSIGPDPGDAAEPPGDADSGEAVAEPPVDEPAADPADADDHPGRGKGPKKER